jgi:predicted ATPase
MLVVARGALGPTLFYLGAVAAAHTHFTHGITLYDPQQHRGSALLFVGEAGVVYHSYAAVALWYLGYPDQGLARNQEAVTLAQQLAHSYSLGFALNWAAIFHQLRREVRAVQERADAVILLAKEQGFPLWVAVGSILHGWALALQGQGKEGIEQLHQGMMAWHATGAEILRPYFLALLAEAYGTIGEPEAGLTVLAEALALVNTTGERWYESEIYRLKGELLLQQSLDSFTEAEVCFQHAISIARAQQAKSWERRASTSLARLWQSQGKRDEARQVLGDVYGWFTEGFDTADLKDAKTLLDELSESRG